MRPGFFLPTQRPLVLLLVGTIAAASLNACTQQIPGSYSLFQQQQTFQTSEQINTKIDMLWVVDNSASMDVSQETLRNGFTAFANTYMKPQWDIQVAAITTDTYLANPQFSNYLATTAISKNTASTYLKDDASVADLNSGTSDTIAFSPNTASWSDYSKTTGFTANITNNELYPSYGPSWGLLSAASQHDGPLASLCYEANTYFFFGEALCYIRDQSPNTGPSHCINPSGNDQFGNPEESTTQCVNTLGNNTVHSGVPIISTLLPTGQNSTTWSNTLINNFLTNLSTGSDGSGSERGMSSVLELMRDNEVASTRSVNANPFFRQGSIRIIVFVSDEDDQTISLEQTDATDPTPSSLVNPSGVFSGYLYTDSSAERTTNCPVTPGNGQTANCCAVKTVSDTTGTYSYTIPVCPLGYPAEANNSNSAVLMPVADIKSKFDAFFENLDGTTTPNYIVASIVVTTAAGVKMLHQTDRCPEQLKIFGGCDPLYDVTSDRGDRYIELASLVGGASGSYDITSGDYSSILTSIGEAIINERFTFTLAKEPTNTEQMIVTIVRADGNSYGVAPGDITISGYTVSLDETVIFGGTGANGTVYPGILATDTVSISYQPTQDY